MDRSQIDTLWFSHESIPGAAFRLNDSVVIVSGEYAEQAGAVISLEALEPEPVYLVELGDDGSGVRLKESVLVAAV